MKINTQLYTCEQAYDYIFRCKPKSGKITHLCFDRNGYLKWFEDNKYHEMSPNEVATEFNMPLWEVCVVYNQRDDDDEYAIILYEAE